MPVQHLIAIITSLVKIYQPQETFTTTGRPDTQQNDNGIIIGGFEYDSDDQEWFNYINVGFGIYNKTSRTASTIVLLYYQHVFLNDDATTNEDFDIQMIGLKIGFGFQL